MAISRAHLYFGDGHWHGWWGSELFFFHGLTLSQAADNMREIIRRKVKQYYAN